MRYRTILVVMFMVLNVSVSAESLLEEWQTMTVPTVTRIMPDQQVHFFVRSTMLKEDGIELKLDLRVLGYHLFANLTRSDRDAEKCGSYALKPSEVRIKAGDRKRKAIATISFEQIDSPTESDLVYLQPAGSHR